MKRSEFQKNLIELDFCRYDAAVAAASSLREDIPERLGPDRVLRAAAFTICIFVNLPALKSVLDIGRGAR